MASSSDQAATGSRHTTIPVTLVGECFQIGEAKVGSEMTCCELFAVKADNSLRRHSFRLNLDCPALRPYRVQRGDEPFPESTGFTTMSARLFQRFFVWDMLGMLNEFGAFDAVTMMIQSFFLKHPIIRSLARMEWFDVPIRWVKVEDHTRPLVLPCIMLYYKIDLIHAYVPSPKCYSFDRSDMARGTPKSIISMLIMCNAFGRTCPDVVVAYYNAPRDDAGFSRHELPSSTGRVCLIRHAPFTLNDTCGERLPSFAKWLLKN